MNVKIFKERHYHDSFWCPKTNKLTIWNIDSDGEMYKDEIIMKPYLYLESNTSGVENRTSLYGKAVTRITFDNRYKYNNALKGLDLKEQKLIHENSFSPQEMGIIADLFPTEQKFDPKYKILYFDIEVHSEEGFPSPEIASWPVTSICVCREWENDKVVVYGCKPLDEKIIKKLPDEAEYFYCEKESLLLIGFLTELEKAHSVAGWNSNQFDFPYLFNRMKRLALIEKNSKIKDILNSGFNAVSVDKGSYLSKKVNTYGQIEYTPRIPGLGLIDLLDLYKKYTFLSLPSYSLDNVGKFEFDDGKLKMYADGGSKELNLVTMFNEHWDVYVEYNIRDVILTRDIARKRALIDLAVEVAAISGIPIDKVTKMSAIIDGALLKFMRPQNKVALGKFATEKQKYSGGYVKEPIDVFGNNKRIYNHTCCFDVTSEYPSVTVKLNISPETYIGKIMLPIFEDQKQAALVRNAIDLLPVEDDALIKIDVYKGEPFCVTSSELKSKFENHEWMVSCDGVLFDSKKEGIFAAFTSNGFAQRKIFKRKFQKHRDLYEENHNEDDKIKRDKYFTKQMGRKLILNSGYGQTGSVFSRLYNPHIAQAITSTGQAIVFNGERFINEYFHKNYVEESDEILEFVQQYNQSIDKVPFWDDSIEDRVVTMDTDSVIFTVDDMTSNIFNEDNGIEFDMETGGEGVAAVKFINSFMKKFIEPKINTYLNADFAYNRLKSKVPFHIGFELEGEKTSIGSIFLKKKKYVHRVPEHKKDNTWSTTLAVKGYELKKVNTPPAIAVGLKEFVYSVFENSHNWNSKYDGFIDAITRVIKLMTELTDTDDKQELMHRLSNSTSINGIEKYMPEPDEKILFVKGAPFHVKGAIMHNIMVEEMGLNIPLINSGDRGMVVKIKETIPKCTAIAFKEQFPIEFLDHFDADVYDVARIHFLNKCTPIFAAFGWEKDWEQLLKKLYKRDNDWPVHDIIDVETIKGLEQLTVRQVKPLPK